MKKIILTLTILFSTAIQAQENTINASFVDIGKKGDADIKDIKVVGDNIFFTGKEFHKRNFAKFNFTENQYTTFSLTEELTDYNNTNYFVINNQIYYQSSNSTIKKTNESNQFEIFFTGTEILDFKQISENHFTFINKVALNNRNFDYQLYLYNATNDTLTQLSTTTLGNYYISFNNIVHTPANTLYFTKNNNEHYKYNIDNSELSRIDTTLTNINLLNFNNSIYAISNSYGSTKPIYKLNENNQFDIVSEYENPEINFSNINKLLEHGNKTYFISGRKLYALDAESNTIQNFNTIEIESYHDLQIYNNEIFISLKSPWPAVYKTYKINGNQIEEFQLPTNDYLSNFIIFDHKIFYNHYSTSSSSNSRIKYFDLRNGETNYINMNYNFPNSMEFNNPFIHNNNLYFNSYSKFDGSEIFKYNAEINEVEIVKNYNTTGSSSPNQFQKVNNRILFFGDENHIFNINLENHQTNLLFDTQKNIFRTLSPKMSINLGDKLIFSNENFELGFTNGTPEGTSLFQRRADSENSLQYFTENSVKLNNKAIFEGRTLYKGNEIWASDGTPDGTIILQDILDGYESSSPRISKDGILNNKLYFVAKKENYHHQFSSIFVTEGTPESTQQINYNTNGLNELRIYGNFQNKLIISEKINNSYDIDYFLLDPITLEKNIFNIFHTPRYFFEFNNTLYLTEYNDLGYYDEDLQLQNITHQQSLSLKPLKKIGNKFYLVSENNGYIYALENNLLQVIHDDYYRLEYRDIIIQEDKILFLKINSFNNDRYSTLQLATIDANGINFRDIDLQDFGENPIYYPRLSIIDDKIYLNILHPKYGEELYVADYDATVLNSTDNDQPIVIKSHFNIYPNPAKNEFYINSKTENQSLNIDIFNLAGQKIKSIQNQSQEKIMTNDLSPGVYFIKISNGTNVETKKLIIK